MGHNEGRRTEGNNIAVSLCDFSESPSIPWGSPVGTASPETVFSLDKITQRLTFPLDLLLDCDTVRFLCVILSMCVCLIHFGCPRGRERWTKTRKERKTVTIEQQRERSKSQRGLQRHRETFHRWTFKGNSLKSAVEWQGGRQRGVKVKCRKEEGRDKWVGRRGYGRWRWMFLCLKLEGQFKTSAKLSGRAAKRFQFSREQLKDKRGSSSNTKSMQTRCSDEHTSPKIK